MAGTVERVGCFDENTALHATDDGGSRGRLLRQPNTFEACGDRSSLSGNVSAINAL